MAFTNQTIVKIVDNQTLLGQDIANVYHYVAPAVIPNPDLAALLANFQQDILGPIADKQHPGVIHTVTDAFQLNNGGNVLSLVSGNIGNRIGSDPSPSWVTASYKLIRNVRDVRNGRKSLCGLLESDISGNTFVTAGTAEWGPLTAVFTATITDGTNNWAPIILGEVDPADPDSFNIGVVVDAQLRDLVGSQLTRKPTGT